MSPKDPFAAREAEKYEKPVASRELILSLIEKNGRPMSRDEIEKTLMLEDEEQIEGLRRRLRAMERDGQLVFTRGRTYALPDKLNLIKGYVIGHKDGFGFIVPDEGGEELFAHFSAIQMAGFKTLKENQRVSFEVTQGPKGKQATNIQAA